MHTKLRIGYKLQTVTKFSQEEHIILVVTDFPILRDTSHNDYGGKKVGLWELVGARKISVNSRLFILDALSWTALKISKFSPS